VPDTDGATLFMALAAAAPINAEELQSLLQMQPLHGSARDTSRSHRSIPVPDGEILPSDDGMLRAITPYVDKEFKQALRGKAPDERKFYCMILPHATKATTELD
jgi:hypothetical protein